MELLRTRHLNPECCPAADFGIWKTFSERAAASDLPQIKSLLSLFIMTMENYRKSFEGFIKMNDPLVKKCPSWLTVVCMPSQWTLNFLLSPPAFWQHNQSPLSKLVSGFTSSDIFAQVHCQFLRIVPCPDHLLSCTMSITFYYQCHIPYRDVKHCNCLSLCAAKKKPHNPSLFDLERVWKSN